MQQILGQDRALDILGSALRSGRFHHAWIFSGPRGVGKFTAAVQIARVLLVPEEAGQRSEVRGQKSGSGDASLSIQNRFPESKTQNQIDAGTHPDLHIIRKELALYSDNRQLRERKQIVIPIDLLRERIIGGMSGDVYHDAPAYRKAAYGLGKVFIIDEAELLDPIAQNALLKTLEEPPAETYFFLITAHPDDLLPTIRSRCQHVRFAPLDDQSMLEWFKRAAEKHPVLGTQNSPVRSWIEQFAEGSPGVAQLALEYNFFQWQSTLEPMLRDLERGRFPAPMGETLAGLVQEFAESWVKSHGEKTTSKDAANKDGARHVFSLLCRYARGCLAESVTSSSGDAAIDWPAVIDLLRDAERNLDSNVNLRMLMENLVVQWLGVGRRAASAA